MGTRNLTCVKLNDDIKVAQYCQWDGYPEGQGITIINFLKNADIDFFKKQVSKIKEISEEKYRQLWIDCGADPNSDLVSLDISNEFKKRHPQLHRDMGAEVLNYIYQTDNPIVSKDLEFAKDSLFCEYAYMLDLDNNTLEVHTSGMDLENKKTLITSFDITNKISEDTFLTQIEQAQSVEN